MRVWFCRENLKKRAPLKEPQVDGRIMDVKSGALAFTASVWLVTGTSDVIWWKSH
jgi:hypothetical protein